MTPAEEEALTEDYCAAVMFMQPIRCLLKPNTAAAIIAQLQLALRHPDNHGQSADIGRAFANELITAFPEAARPILMLGFDPAHDRPGKPR